MLVNSQATFLKGCFSQYVNDLQTHSRGPNLKYLSQMGLQLSPYPRPRNTIHNMTCEHREAKSRKMVLQIILCVI
jgi:hypothetical protein